MTAELSLRIKVDVPLSQAPLRLDLETDARRIAIDGPSGAGKSTTLRVLAGVERRARGEVSAFGETWLDSERGRSLAPWKRGIGWCPQDALLFPHESVRRNLGWAGAAPPEIAEVAALLGVEALLDRRPRNLSGGERQRVALGRALLARPRLLLLDEPFSALDAPLRAGTLDALVRWCDARSLAVVLASHDSEAVSALADEKYVLHEGRLERTR